MVNEKRDGMREMPGMRDWWSYPRNVAISGPRVTTGPGALPDTGTWSPHMVIIGGVTSIFALNNLKRLELNTWEN